MSLKLFFILFALLANVDALKVKENVDGPKPKPERRAAESKNEATSGTETVSPVPQEVVDAKTYHKDNIDQIRADKLADRNGDQYGERQEQKRTKQDADAETVDNRRHTNRDDMEIEKIYSQYERNEDAGYRADDKLEDQTQIRSGWKTAKESKEADLYDERTERINAQIARHNARDTQKASKRAAKLSQRAAAVAAKKAKRDAKNLKKWGLSNGGEGVPANGYPKRDYWPDGVDQQA